MANRAAFVRYSSPFGSPSAYMAREEAERHLQEDEELWLLLTECHALTPEQRAHGPAVIQELPR